MSKLLSLLLVVLFTFNVAVVAHPKALGHQSNPAPTSPSVDDISHLSTNAKRFAAGFPPLPPLVKRPTRVGSAKRAVTSQCAKSGVIQVLNANTNAVEGYVSKTLQGNQRYGLEVLTEAGTFSSSVFVSGQTENINILDVTDGTHFLAGLIASNQPLGDGSGDDQAAILGRSLATNPGSTPQADKDPSFNNRDSETAIWTYDSGSKSLTATWVNYAGQTPATTTAYISYLSNGNGFYLTNTRTAPQNGIPVLFQFVSVNDQCG